MKRWKIATIVLSCLVLAGSVACNPLGGGEKENPGQLVEVVRGDLTVSVDGSGNIAVVRDADLTFGSAGRVDRIYVEEGDAVWQGRVLAGLDSGALEIALTEAEAALMRAEASLGEAQAAQLRAEAVLEQEEEDLKVVKRQSILGYRRTIAELEFEAAELNVESAELSVGAAESQLDAAEQAVAEAQKQLDEATITAPFAGVVSDIYVDEDDTVSTATTIVYLIDLTTMELTVEVDEIDIPLVEMGQRATIEVDALPGLIIEGKVTSIRHLPTVESGVVLYDVEIDFTVPQDSGLKVGMSAEAEIILDGRSDVLLIPDWVIGQDSQGNDVVWVLSGEQIEQRSIVTGISDDFYTEVVSGLKEGEMVVVGKQEQSEEEESGQGFPFH